MFGAGFGAVHAADALAAVGCLDGVDAHLACFCTFSAVDAFALIDFKANERNPVKKRIYRAERTDVLAKRPPYN